MVTSDDSEKGTRCSAPMPANGAVVNHLHNTKPEVQSHATYPHSGRPVDRHPSRRVSLQRVEQQRSIGRIRVVARYGHVFVGVVVIVYVVGVIVIVIVIVVDPRRRDGPRWDLHPGPPR